MHTKLLPNDWPTNGGFVFTVDCLSVCIYSGTDKYLSLKKNQIQDFQKHKQKTGAFKTETEKTSTKPSYKFSFCIGKLSWLFWTSLEPSKVSFFMLKKSLSLKNQLTYQLFFLMKKQQ